MGVTSERIASLTAEKRLLLELLRKERRSVTARPVSEPSEAPAAPTANQPFSLISAEDRGRLPEDVEDAYPLGVVQIGMLFHMAFQEQKPSPPAYHNVSMTRIQLPCFDIAAFQQAVDLVVARHAILRTSFDLSNYTEPLQLVHRTARLLVEYTDLREVAPAEQQRICNTYVQQQNFRLVDIATAPMVHFTVHQLTDDTITLTLIEPHSISDGWSTHLTLVEIFNNHHALVSGAALPDQTPPAVSYRDFIQLEREALSSEEHRHFWRTHLQDCTVAQLPRLSELAEGETGWQDHKVLFKIAPKVVDGLRQLARSLGVPLKSVLLAAHLKVMSLVSGTDDVAVGVEFNGRPELAGGDDVRGLFLNTLPLRVQLGEATWVDLVRKAFAAETEILPYRRYPLAQLQQDLNNRALIGVLFSYHHFHSIREMSQTGKLDSLEAVTDLSRTNFPLEIAFNASAEATSQINLLIEYDVTVYRREQVLALRGYYDRVLAAMSAHPTERHSARSFLAPEEWRRIVHAWNATARALPAEITLIDLIEAQAPRTPDAVAAVFTDQQLSYRQLDQRANHLAHVLRAQGIGPETLVGVCCQRSLDLIVALIAVLKAGGAYVPLDPSYPAERLAFMLDDARVTLLLTQRELRDQFAGAPQPLFCMEDVAGPDQVAPAPPPRALRPEHLAYVIYTSGSTGTPKGAMNTHAGICNRLLWMQETYRLTGDDRVLQKTPSSFDVSVWEFFWPLIAGATLVFAIPEGQRDSSYLRGAIVEHGVTTLHFVPSMLQMFLLEDGLEQCTSLRRVICSGEALTAELQRRFFERLGAELHNLYGPTEAAVDVTAWACERATAGAAVPIGLPIANTQIYLLDRHGHPTPVGVPGELYIGGVQIGRGYWQQPALTAGRFVPNPFADERRTTNDERRTTNDERPPTTDHRPTETDSPAHSLTRSPVHGGRLYKTGDLARYRPDGAIEFLGRNDQQVKIRGVRIELGEVEAALLQNRAVYEAAVLAHEVEGDPHDRRLTAYVVPLGQANVTIEQLRADLQTRLPQSMLPSFFVFLDQLPLTPSGKLDRRALPAPDQTRASLRQQYVPPQDAIQAQMVRIWEMIFDVRPIGITDNFFDLGGNSLMAIRLLTLIKERMGQTLLLATLFAEPTVEQLAKQVHSYGWPGVLTKVDNLPTVDSSLVRIQPNGSKTPLFFVAPLGGVVPSNVLVGFMDLVPYLGDDQPFYGLQLPGVAQDRFGYLDLTKLLTPDEVRRQFADFKPGPGGVEEAAMRCVRAIQTVQPEGPYLIGGFCSGAIVAFEMGHILRQMGQDVAYLAIIDAFTSTYDPQDVEEQRQQASEMVADQRLEVAIERLATPDLDELAWFISRDLGWGLLERELRDMEHDLRQLDPRDYWTYAEEHLKRANMIAASTTPDEIRRLFHLYQINLLSIGCVLDRYVARPYDQQLTLFFTRKGLELNLDSTGWSSVCADLNCHFVTGDHGTLFREPYIQVLAAEMKADLEAVQGRFERAMGSAPQEAP